MSKRRTNKELLMLEVNINKMFQDGYDVKAIAEKMNISRNYAYLKLREMGLSPIVKIKEVNELKMIKEICLLYEMENIRVVEIMNYYHINSNKFYSYLRKGGKHNINATC